MVGKEDKTKPIQRCKCCNLNTNKIQHSLCAGVEISENGESFALYFYFLKLLFFLGFIIALSQIPKVVTNIEAGRCSNYEGVEGCDQNYITVHSIANFGESKLDYIHFVSTAIGIVIFLLCHAILTSRALIYTKYIDQTTYTASDYTIEANGLGTQVSKSQVKKYFEEKGAEVSDVELVHSLLQSKKIDIRIEELETKIQKLEIKLGQTEKLLNAPKKKLKKLKEKIIFFNKEINSLVIRRKIALSQENIFSSKRKFLGTAFVSFQNAEAKEKFIERTNCWVFRQVQIIVAIVYQFATFSCLKKPQSKPHNFTGQNLRLFT